MVLWEGESLVDGSPITLHGTINSTNRKTGPMGQTWIMRRDINPMAAIKSGQDVSVCGDCPLRSSINGGCYVVPMHGPNNIFKSNDRTHKDVFKSWILHYGMRVGSYGDPVVIPFSIWEEYLISSAFVTGYTHLWSTLNIDQRWKDWIMASTEGDNWEVAVAQGWSVFNIQTNDNIPPHSSKCNSSAGGCFHCKKCNGRNGNVFTYPHGRGKGKITNKLYGGSHE